MAWDLDQHRTLTGFEVSQREAQWEMLEAMLGVLEDLEQAAASLETAAGDYGAGPEARIRAAANLRALRLRYNAFRDIFSSPSSR